MDSNHRFLARKSRFLLWKANCGDRTGVAKKGCFLCGTDGSNPSPSTGESTANLIARLVAVAAIEAFTFPPGVINWNDADDNNAFHAKLMVMDFDGTISTEVAIYDKKQDYDDIVTRGLPLLNRVPQRLIDDRGVLARM